MIEEYINKLLKKIRNKDFNFDWGEQQSIYSDALLAKEFIEVVNKDFSLWKEEFDTFFGTTIYYEVRPLPDGFLDNIAKWHIDNNILNSTFFGLISSDEYVGSNFWNYLNENLDNPSFKFDVLNIEAMNEKLMNLLLDKKRYDALSKFEINGFIKPELLDRLFNEYPFIDYPFPKFFDSFIKSFTNNNLKLKYINLIKDNITIAMALSLFNRDLIDNDNLKDIIMKKIMDENSTIELPYKFAFSSIQEEFSIEERQKIYFYSLKKKDLSLIFSSSDDFTSATKFIEQVAQLISSEIELPKKLENKSLLENKLIKDSLKNKLAVTDIPGDFKLSLSNTKDYTNSSIVELLKSPSLNNSFNYESNLFNKVEIDVYSNISILADLLRTNKYEEFFEILKRCTKIKSFFEENYELVESHIKSNYPFSKKLLFEYTDEVVMNQNLMILYSNLDISFFEHIINYIEATPKCFGAYSEEIFEKIKLSLAKKYKLNLAHLTKLESLYGPSVIAVIKSQSIQNIVNLNDNDFNKFCDLFKVDAFISKKSLSSEIYDAFKQLEFMSEHANTMLIFQNIKESINNNDVRTKILLDEIKNYLDDDKYKKFKKLYNSKFNIEEDKDELFSRINQNIRLKSNSVETLNLIHELCNFYIARKREDYRKTYDFDKDLNLQRVPEEKNYIPQFMKNLLSNGYILENNEKVPFINLLVDNSDNLSNDMILDCVNYYLCGLSYEKFNNDMPEVKKNIKNLLKLSEFCLNRYYNSLNIKELQRLTNEKCTKHYYYIAERKKELEYLCNELGIDILSLGCLHLYIDALDNNNISSFMNLLNTKSKVKPNIEGLMKKYKLNNEEEVIDLLEKIIIKL